MFPYISDFVEKDYLTDTVSNASKLRREERNVWGDRQDITFTSLVVLLSEKDFPI